jgi:hypothetical protein
MYIFIEDSTANKDEEGNEDVTLEEEAEEEEMDEVTGYHFMECATLFISYVYITSGGCIYSTYKFSLFICSFICYATIKLLSFT